MFTACSRASSTPSRKRSSASGGRPFASSHSSSTGSRYSSQKRRLRSWISTSSGVSARSISASPPGTRPSGEGGRTPGRRTASASLSGAGEAARTRLEHGDAERADERGEVRLREVDAVRPSVRAVLVDAQDPVPAVVDDEELRPDPVLPRGQQLEHRVEHAPVAVHGEHLRPGPRHLRADRRGPRVPERAGAQRIEERPGRVHVEERRGEVAGQRHVADQDVVPAERGTEVGEQVQLRVAPLRGESGADPVVHGPDAFRAVGLVPRDARRERLEHDTRVAGDAEPRVRRAEVLGTRVDLDQATLELERPLARRLGSRARCRRRARRRRCAGAPGTLPRRRPSRARAGGRPGSRPCPCTWWQPGASSCSASARNAAEPPARSTPPPPHSTGRSAASSRPHGLGEQGRVGRGSGTGATS